LNFQSAQSFNRLASASRRSRPLRVTAVELRLISSTTLLATFYLTTTQWLSSNQVLTLTSIVHDLWHFEQHRNLTLFCLSLLSILRIVARNYESVYFPFFLHLLELIDEVFAMLKPELMRISLIAQDLVFDQNTFTDPYYGCEYSFSNIDSGFVQVSFYSCSFFSSHLSSLFTLFSAFWVSTLLLIWNSSLPWAVAVCRNKQLPSFADSKWVYCWEFRSRPTCIRYIKYSTARL
jgi:hypothetical protein